MDSDKKYLSEIKKIVENSEKRTNIRINKLELKLEDKIEFLIEKSELRMKDKIKDLSDKMDENISDLAGFNHQILNKLDIVTNHEKRIVKIEKKLGTTA